MDSIDVNVNVNYAWMQERGRQVPGLLDLVQEQADKEHAHANHEQNARKAHQAVVSGKEVDQCFHGHLLLGCVHFNPISVMKHDLSQACGTMLRHIERDQHLEHV